ncbi:hypothetical protein K469DRAFT_686482 [Zopfia rhizophila CBS 207.26]|uniref:Uncharacterized protein n=1 Tax=Zopfia rhizophila CBS 207.26 TaxID=1314779 RepID=A0A6A6EQI9_9PEZI|nr:hypothetical protein K469DRAFT_686482 [Zopfia rhizophila CBS 207.26]
MSDNIQPLPSYHTRNHQLPASQNIWAGRVIPFVHRIRANLINLVTFTVILLAYFITFGVTYAIFRSDRPMLLVLWFLLIPVAVIILLGAIYVWIRMRRSK